MSDSNSSSNPTAPRVTLKLKPGVRKPRQETKTPPPTAPIARPPSNGKSKPGAHWSDEYKERMQAEMDALTVR